MAQFLRASRRSFLSSYKTLISQQQFSVQPNKTSIPNFLRQFSRSQMSEKPLKPPVESNIFRILNNKIDYQYEYAPPNQVIC